MVVEHVQWIGITRDGRMGLIPVRRRGMAVHGERKSSRQTRGGCGQHQEPTQSEKHLEDLGFVGSSPVFVETAAESLST
jgi:hypothetical protein